MSSNNNSIQSIINQSIIGKPLAVTAILTIAKGLMRTVNNPVV
jgi:hypothetical protein